MEERGSTLQIVLLAASDASGQRRREEIADVLERFHSRRCASVECLRLNLAGGAEFDPKPVEDTFAQLRRSDAIYGRSGDSGESGQWYFRRSDHDAENHSRVAELAGWTEAAARMQLQGLAPVEGVEFEAVGLDGRRLPVFTPLPDAIEETAFVLISPRHPEIEAWAPEAGGIREAGSGILDTGVLFQLPRLDNPVPLVVSAQVDARFGATAVLGIPSREPADRELAKRLPARSPGLRLRTKVGKAEVRPALRFAPAGDQPVVESGSGIRLPPGAVADETGEEVARWFAAAAAAQAGPAVDRRLLVHGVADGAWVLQARSIAKALRDAAGNQGGEAGEPFAGAVACGDVTVPGDDADAGLAAITARYGSETVRLALLGDRRPDTALALDERSLQRAQARIERLRSFALERLEPGRDATIDRSDRSRARLAYWGDTAIKRITSQLDSFDFHHAVQSLERLAERIEVFEQLSEGQGEEPTTQEAAQAAVHTWVALADPLLPELAGELRQAAGLDPPEGWPQPLGPPARSEPAVS